MHGKTSNIHVDTACPLFKGLPENIEAARYHSLIVKKEGLPDCLKVTAQDDEKQIMGFAHRDYPVFGIQFHPESFMTQHGLDIIKNFIDIQI